MKNWSLVSEVRNVLLAWWQGIAIGVVALLLVQTIMNRYDRIEALVWTWAAVMLLPGITVLYGSALFRNNIRKMVAPPIRRAVHSLSISYLLAVFAVLLLQERWLEINTEKGLNTYFQSSFLWLLPLNGVVNLILALLLFRNEPIVIPDAKAIGEVAQSKVAKTPGNNLSLQKQCLELIASGNLETVFEVMNKHLADQPSSDTFQELAVLSGEFYELRRQTHLNTIDPAQTQRNINRIAVALLAIADDIRN